MTQFALLKTSSSRRFRHLCDLDEALENPVRDAALHYFGTTEGCLVVKNSTAAIDSLWEAQESARDFRRTSFYCLAVAVLATPETAMLCWCGNDFLNLTRVSSVADMEAELLEQTKVQPADVYIFVQGKTAG